MLTCQHNHTSREHTHLSDPDHLTTPHETDRDSNIHPTKRVKAHPHTTVEWPAQGGLLYTLRLAVAGSGSGGLLVAHLGPSCQHVNMLAVPHQL
jgi:hypothetical protein